MIQSQVRDEADSVPTPLRGKIGLPTYDLILSDCSLLIQVLSVSQSTPASILSSLGELSSLNKNTESVSLT